MTDIRIPASQVTPDPVSALIAAYHADLLALEVAYTEACQKRREQFNADVNKVLRPETALTLPEQRPTPSYDAIGAEQSLWLERLESGWRNWMSGLPIPKCETGASQ